MKRKQSSFTALALPACASLLVLLSPAVQAASPEQMLANYVTEAARPADAQRGRAFFAASHGQTLTCTACHGDDPRQPGKHSSTGKVIAPLAPAANAERFTDVARTEKWFRRNCKEVVGRECTPAEKADVLAWLLQPAAGRAK